MKMPDPRIVFERGMTGKSNINISGLLVAIQVRQLLFKVLQEIIVNNIGQQNIRGIISHVVKG